MKTKIKSIGVLLVFLVSTCSLYGQVSADYDKSVDFTKYKTFKFLGWEKDSGKLFNDIDKDRLLKAFKSELAARDLSPTENIPDVGITLFIVIDNKTSTTAYTNFNGGLGYARGWGWGGGMGSATTTYNENDYQEGTLVIDFYDETTKKLVFQGVLQTVVKEKAKKREKSIPKNVAKLMYKYPVKAGR